MGRVAKSAFAYFCVLSLLHAPVAASAGQNRCEVPKNLDQLINTLSEKTTCANLASLGECRTLVDSNEKGPLVGAMIGAVVAADGGAETLLMSTASKEARLARLTSGEVQFPVIDKKPGADSSSYAKEFAGREVQAATTTARLAAEKYHVSEAVEKALNDIETSIRKRLEIRDAHMKGVTKMSAEAAEIDKLLKDTLGAISRMKSPQVSSAAALGDLVKIMEFSKDETGLLSLCDNVIRKEATDLGARIGSTAAATAESAAGSAARGSAATIAEGIAAGTVSQKSKNAFASTLANSVLKFASPAKGAVAATEGLAGAATEGLVGAATGPYALIAATIFETMRSSPTDCSGATNIIRGATDDNGCDASKDATLGLLEFMAAPRDRQQLYYSHPQVKSYVDSLYCRYSDYSIQTQCKDGKVEAAGKIGGRSIIVTAEYNSQDGQIKKVHYQRSPASQMGNNAVLEYDNRGDLEYATAIYSNNDNDCLNPTDLEKYKCRERVKVSELRRSVASAGLVEAFKLKDDVGFVIGANQTIGMLKADLIRAARGCVVNPNSGESGTTSAPVDRRGTQERSSHY